MAVTGEEILAGLSTRAPDGRDFLSRRPGLAPGSANKRMMQAADAESDPAKGAWDLSFSPPVKQSLFQKPLGPRMFVDVRGPLAHCHEVARSRTLRAGSSRLP